jgi:uncharacterized protein (TIGR02001 family)
MVERRHLCVKVSLGRYRARFYRLDLGILGSSLVRTGLGFISVAIAACLPESLHAQSTNVSGAVALSSQLVDRGLAIAPATPALQGAVSWTSPAGWSLGLSGSAELRSPGRVIEALVQASRFWSLSSDWQMQASLLYYNYPGTAHSRVFDRTETGVNWIYRDILTFGLSAVCVIGAKDHQPRGAADLSLHWPLAWHFSLSAGAGVAQSLIAPHAPNAPNSSGYSHASLYGYGQAGLTWGNGPWRVELDRVMTDQGMQRHRDDLRASPWTATISRSF